MKRLHRDDFFGWSRFDESRNLDFNAVLWRRPLGNVVVDPMPLSAHDEGHLRDLGGASLIIVTNSDHVRGTREMQKLTGARVAGPRAEKDNFPIECDLWLGDGDQPIPGVTVIELQGSKTPGELALVIEDKTLIVGDLVRAHQGGRLAVLPAAKLSNPADARRSVGRLARLTAVDAVLTGDGWPIFRDGHRALAELAAEVRVATPY